jgi:5-methyltetrahydrofolate--homocysteine methyltransferase
MPAPNGSGGRHPFLMDARLTNLSTALQKGDRESVVSLVRASLDGPEPLTSSTILNEGLLPGMQIVGDRFRAYDLFLPDVLLAARAMSAAMELLKPRLVAAGIPGAGRIVLGTVRGDLHDIGKNLVGIMLEGAGFEVIDLGTDVAPESFVDAAIAHDARIIGLSALLTTTMTGMKDVIDLIAARGESSRLQTIIGGAPVSAAYAREIGADAYAVDAPGAVDQIRALTERR